MSEDRFRWWSQNNAFLIDVSIMTGQFNGHIAETERH